MSDNNNDETEAGAMDDDAMERAKSSKQSKQSQLDQLFNDNESSRYSGPTDS